MSSFIVRKLAKLPHWAGFLLICLFATAVGYYIGWLGEISGMSAAESGAMITVVSTALRLLER